MIANIKDITILPIEIWNIINDYKNKMEIQDEIKKYQGFESHKLYTLCYMIHNKYPRWKINQFKLYQKIGEKVYNYAGTERFKRKTDDEAIIDLIANSYEVNSGSNDRLNWKYDFSDISEKYKWGFITLSMTKKKKIIEKVLKDLTTKYGDNLRY